MAAALSSLTPFVQTYGSLFLPIAADLVTTSLFKRATRDGKAELGGSIAGIGTLYFLGRQTSLVIGLTGAVLYLIYKGTAIIQAANPHLNLAGDMIVVEREWLELQKSIDYVAEEALDFTASDFQTKCNDLIEKLEPQTLPLKKMWENQDFLIKTQRIVEQCQKVLITIHTDLKQQVFAESSNLTVRSQKMAALLKDPSYRLANELFGRAFTLLNEVYRIVRCKGYTISLPNILNCPDKKHSMIATDEEIASEYCQLFFTDETPQRAMNKIFNNTQDELAGLIQILYPDSPLTAKDEMYIPGDFGNPSNPFKIKHV